MVRGQRLFALVGRPGGPRATSLWSGWGVLVRRVRVRRLRGASAHGAEAGRTSAALRSGRRRVASRARRWRCVGWGLGPKQKKRSRAPRSSIPTTRGHTSIGDVRRLSSARQTRRRHWPRSQLRLAWSRASPARACGSGAPVPRCRPDTPNGCQTAAERHWTTVPALGDELRRACTAARQDGDPDEIAEAEALLAALEEPIPRARARLPILQVNRPHHSPSTVGISDAQATPARQTPPPAPRRPDRVGPRQPAGSRAGRRR